MAIRPILIDEHSPFLEESCALCKEPFDQGEQIVVCPDDAARHHVSCWEANNNHCTAFGCTGQGEVIQRGESLEAEEEFEESEPESAPVLEPEIVESIAFRRRGVNGARRTVRETETEPRSKVRTMPSSTFGCAQGCMVLAIALAIVVMSVSCFGLWAIMDYLMLEVFGLEYRQPLSELIRPGGPLFMLLLTFSPSVILR